MSELLRFEANQLPLGPGLRLLEASAGTGKTFLAAVQAVVTRAARLAEKGNLAPDVLSAAAVVNPALFEQPSEAAMLQVLEGLEPIATGSDADRYGQLAQGLTGGANALAAFFDGDQSVMVMADDPAVRTNRLNLLAVLRNQASVLADFSRLSG